MSFSYQVVLRPSDVKFPGSRVPCKFDNGIKLKQLVNDIKDKKTQVKDVPPIQVVWYCDKWEWYTLNSRRLYVYQQLEKAGHLTYVSMKRVELIDIDYDYPERLFKEVELYEPEWDIRATVNNLKVSKSLESAKELKKVAHLAKMEKSAKHVSSTSLRSDNELVQENVGLKGEEVELKVKSEDCEIELEMQSKMVQSIVVPKSNRNVALEIDETGESSKICRKQRIISSSAGLHGYGYYHQYKISYLDKIRSAKFRALRMFKPYDANKSAYSRIFSRSLSDASRSRSISRESLASSSKRSVFSSSRRSSTSVDQGYLSEDDAKSKRKCKEVVLFRRSRRDSITSSLESLNLSGFEDNSKIKELYALWKKRRAEYLENGKWALQNASMPPYLCGLCFKYFTHIVDLQQHSESLLHFACVTCGKFFASYASLGQHCRILRHKKD